MRAAIGDYFAAFDERAGEPARRKDGEDSYGGASAGFCLAALVGALCFVFAGGGGV